MNKLAQLFVWAGTRARPSIPRRTPAALGSHFDNVLFSSACTDAVQLSGWLIPATEGARAVVILCHGHLGTRLEMIETAVMLSRHHFTTLLFDFRARGTSQGVLCTMGLHEACDVIGSVECVAAAEQTSGLPVLAIGNSMGGAALIRAAVTEQRIRAIVIEGTFASFQTVLEHRARMTTGPFGSGVVAGCAQIAQSQMSLNIEDINPARDIASISPRPVFLITDGLDLTCPRGESDRLFAAAGEPKHRWVASRAPHVFASRVYRAEYERRVVAFLSEAIE